MGKELVWPANIVGQIPLYKKKPIPSSGLLKAVSDR